MPHPTSNSAQWVVCDLLTSDRAAPLKSPEAFDQFDTKKPGCHANLIQGQQEKHSSKMKGGQKIGNINKHNDHNAKMNPPGHAKQQNKSYPIFQSETLTRSFVWTCSSLCDPCCQPHESQKGSCSQLNQDLPQEQTRRPANKLWTSLNKKSRCTPRRAHRKRY